MFISIDIGGTNMRAALVDLDGGGRIVRLESQPVVQDYAAGMEKLCGLIASLSEGQAIEGIGACFPGIINDGVINEANNLPDWAMKPIRQTLEQRFGVPVKLLHDAQGAALGEALYGAARQAERFVYFIWGTGIGAADARKIDGRRYLIAPFENGHHIVEWDGKLCTCGQRGCAEAWLGGSRLKEYFGADMPSVSDDDPRWELIIQKAAQTVLNTLVMHPVSLFVFNGGVIRHRAFLLERIRQVLQEQSRLFPAPEMVLAEKGDEAALFGCAGAFKVDLI
jgi:predicted NBD/HSP70 family sugar kinase